MRIELNELGRSMIEMLGVLAIAGILSVGGIAGYGKAMSYWRIVKSLGEYNLFLQEMLSYKKDFQKMMKRGGGGYFYLASVAEKSGLLPSGWERGTDSNTNRIFMRMGNIVVPMVRSANDTYAGRLDFEIHISKELGENAKEFCRLMFRDVLLPNCEDLYAVQVVEKRDGRWNIASGTRAVAGCLRCSPSRRCIRDLSVIDIENLCRACSEEQEGCILMTVF